MPTVSQQTWVPNQYKTGSEDYCLLILYSHWPASDSLALFYEYIVPYCSLCLVYVSSHNVLPDSTCRFVEREMKKLIDITRPFTECVTGKMCLRKGHNSGTRCPCLTGIYTSRHHGIMCSNVLMNDFYISKFTKNLNKEKYQLHPFYLFYSSFTYQQPTCFFFNIICSLFLSSSFSSCLFLSSCLNRCGSLASSSATKKSYTYPYTFSYILSFLFFQIKKLNL